MSDDWLVIGALVMSLVNAAAIISITSQLTKINNVIESMLFIQSMLIAEVFEDMEQENNGYE